ncbi:MAG: cytochrome c [Alphaproteobacteria bacterium]|nr:cytochrome c [Alphaproteobacteria bacterium]MBU1560722.1 cytochrome c [Alphaproteobacteria bacterium]MBU2302931.1 cytochrome c [Alphaproteobacteria bacterium]MBU2367658.1 cytochrome c [Alphaproteobacteria bacterium]
MPCHRSAQYAVVLIAATLSTLAVPGRAEDIHGRQLYVDHCASCHGVNLEGQPDWKQRLPTGRLPAPPHDATGHTWHHSDRQLFRIVKEGPVAIMPGYETDMPGFGPVLDDDEITAVLDYIKGTWPEHERDVQAAKSAADPF